MSIKVYRNGAWEEKGGKENGLTKEELVLHRYDNLESLIVRWNHNLIARIDTILLYLSGLGYVCIYINFTLANSNNAWNTKNISDIITINADAIASMIGLNTKRYFHTALVGEFSTNGVKTTENYAVAKATSLTSESVGHVSYIDINKMDGKAFTLEAGESGFLRLRGFYFDYE